MVHVHSHVMKGRNDSIIVKGSGYMRMMLVVDVHRLDDHAVSNSVRGLKCVRPNFYFTHNIMT